MNFSTEFRENLVFSQSPQFKEISLNSYTRTEPSSSFFINEGIDLEMAFPESNDVFKRIRRRIFTPGNQN